MEEEDEWKIEEDKRAHPNCSYAQTLSKSCSNANGKFVCDTIKNIQRLCPGQKPVSIVSRSEVGDSQQDDTPGFNIMAPFTGRGGSGFGLGNFGGFGGLGGFGDDSQEGSGDPLSSLLEGFIRGFGGQNPAAGSQLPPTRRNDDLLPPHARGSGAAPRSQRKISGWISGPVEDI